MSTSAGVPEWSEADSRLYRELAEIAVPRRAEQIAAIVTLTPFACYAEFAIVERACGEGRLAEALLEAYPKARYLGLDGSESMRREAAARLAGFGDRVRIEAFDLFASDWLDRVTGAGLVVSSLCVH